MATNVAIIGFGRSGRLVARAILERSDHDLELVSINDLADTKSNALLFQYDSTHGRFPGTVDVADGASDGDLAADAVYDVESYSLVRTLGDLRIIEVHGVEAPNAMIGLSGDPSAGSDDASSLGRAGNGRVRCRECLGDALARQDSGAVAAVGDDERRGCCVIGGRYQEQSERRGPGVERSALERSIRTVLGVHGCERRLKRLSRRSSLL